MLCSSTFKQFTVELDMKSDKEGDSNLQLKEAGQFHFSET